MMNLETQKMSSLYLLVFPDTNLLKIGKANDVRDRCKSLKGVWGTVDFDKSFEIVAPTKTVFEIERTLHFLASSYTKDFKKGDGCTEVFSLNALDVVLKHIDIFIGSSTLGLTVVEGIKERDKAKKETGY